MAETKTGMKLLYHSTQHDATEADTELLVTSFIVPVETRVVNNQEECDPDNG